VSNRNQFYFLRSVALCNCEQHLFCTFFSLSSLNCLTSSTRYTHDHPHFLLRVHARPPDAPGNRVPEGCLGVSEIQRIGNHVCVGEPYTWRLYNEWRSVPILADLTLEVRHRFPSRFASTSESSSSSSSPSNAVKLKASALAEACAKFLFGLVVTVNETFLITFEGTELVCRVVDVVPEDATDGEEGGHEGGDGEDDDALTLPDHFRGMVEAGTRVFLAVDLNTCAQTLALEGNVTKASAPLPKNIVKVTHARLPGCSRCALCVFCMFLRYLLSRSEDLFFLNYCSHHAQQGKGVVLERASKIFVLRVR